MPSRRGINNCAIRISMDKQKKITGLLLVLPTFVAMISLTFYPIFLNFILGFSKVELPSLSTRFSGLHNYVELFRDPLFHTALINSAIWVAGTVPIQLLLGLGTALVLNQRLKGRLFFSAAAIIPWSVSPVASAMVWSWLYHPDFGFINTTLMRLGLSGLTERWLSNPNTALPATIVAYIWAGAPVATFVLLGALQSISSSVYDAAEVDGASRLQIFRYVVLPHLKPIMRTLILLLTFFSISSSISYVYPMTGGGPANATMVADLYIYDIIVKDLRFELGAAASCLLFFVTLFMAMINVYLQRLSEREGS